MLIQNAKGKISPARNTDPAKELENAKYILARNVIRDLDERKTLINNNIIVAGSSGSFKTSRFVEPNLQRAEGNYVISDPKGSLIKKYYWLFKEKGYDVIQVDFQDPATSMHWNPLTQITCTQDIMKIASALCLDKTSRKATIDPYWDSMALLFTCALIGYMFETGYKPCSFRGILNLLREGDRHERVSGSGSYRTRNPKASALSDRFEELYRKHPDSWAYEQFKNVDAAPDKTFDTIRSVLVSKFSNYSTKEIDEMTSSNDIDFSELSEKKTIIFVIQSDHDRAMDGLVNLFFSQAIDGFIKSADTYPNQRLPIPVRFFLDDYGATTVIDNLDAMISTIRSRGISVVLILQSEAQLLKAGYGENKTIISNCDTYIYTGGNDIETARAVSTRCNKPLQQVLYMPVGYCWVFTRGSKPVFTQLADRQEVPERYEMISVPATKKPEMKPYASEDPLEEFMELLEFADIT